MPRSSEYTQEIADAICERLADGESLRSICSGEGMPSRMTVFRWLSDPERVAFRDQYARAREEQAEFYAESIIDIADEEVTMIRADKHKPGADEDAEIEVVFDSAAIARNRLRVDARKWYASKLAPKKYGDFKAVELTGANGGPMVFQASATDERI